MFLKKLLVFNTPGENVSAQTYTRNIGKKMVKPPFVGFGCSYLCPRTSWSSSFNTG